MFLGIEIGGTKLQLGVGRGDGTFVVPPVPIAVDRAAGASGIRAAIVERAPALIREQGVSAVGIGFGGPVDAGAGRTITSHQIVGWDDFALGAWCRDALGLPCAIGNDADLAALAEARFGAGRGGDPVFYVTVGTGVGGGLIVGGRPYLGHGPGVAEIGHLRPGPTASEPHDTVESIASGLAIERAAAKLNDDPIFEKVSIGGGSTGGLAASGTPRITAKELAWAASQGHAPSQAILDRATTTLGWAIAQMITLLAPQIVVVGGGVSLLGEDRFYEPVRRAVDRYVFPPLRGAYRIVPPELGETTVVHGALALASGSG